MGILYVVATPIGNLDDITIRALKVLLSVDGIACEDTRKSGQMLRIFRERYAQFLAGEEIELPDQRIFSYYEQNEKGRIPEIVTALKNGLNIALISDAGTPAISDPGYRIVKACLDEGIRVVPVPGVSSVLAAFVAAGLPTDKLLFLGYPPHKSGKRLQLYENLKKSQEYIASTCIFFEAPHKLVKTLEEMKSVFGDIEMVFARELTKVHEEFLRISLSKAIEQYSKYSPKGEFVLLFHLGIE